MTSTAPFQVQLPPEQFPESFEAWRATVRGNGVLPVIAIAGSRGKSSVISYLQRIMDAAQLRVATWTDFGITIHGRKQRGELLPWRRAMDQLAAGTLDLAIQELDWDTMHAVGLPAGSYPVFAVTNLCVNSEACLLREDTMRALKTLKTLAATPAPETVFILNGEDYSVAGGALEHMPRQVIFGLNRDAPLIRAKQESGGAAVWLGHEGIFAGSLSKAEYVLPRLGYPSSRPALTGFQAANMLAAIAIARSIGIEHEHIVAALEDPDIKPEELPGSFNLVVVRGARIIVDRPAPSWFLKAPLRTLGHMHGGRQVRVAGSSQFAWDEDLYEQGRLIGRDAGLIVLHGDAASKDHAGELWRGLAANDVPPVIVRASDEAAAVTVVLRMLRPDDLVYILADDPRGIVRKLNDIQVID